MDQPFLGLIYHWLGGLAAASFYIPYRGVRKWSWETYWLVGGFFSWIIAPAAFAWLLVPGLWHIIAAASGKTLFWTWLFGAMWGIGGLTFGLSMRYLGIALGMAVALGFCAAFGTLVPPLVAGEFGRIVGTESGVTVLLGVLVCLAGIGVSGMAGMAKERELSPAQKAASVKEFNFGKGVLVAMFAGIMSSCFAYGLAAGRPLADLAKGALLQHERSDLWQNLPVLVVVLSGGFTTNFIWCIVLNLRNRTGGEYLRSSCPLGRNYVLSAVAGITWYLQFFFYSMGATRLGRYEFSSWTLHMASIIIFSTLWGIALHEWKDTGPRTRQFVACGLVLLVASTVIVGYGNFIGTAAKH